MDGRGRVFDNIFVERLWRTLKHEDIYLKDYQSVVELFKGLTGAFPFSGSSFYKREMRICHFFQ